METPNTALDQAVFFGDARTVEVLLLSDKVLPNLRDKDGMTALHRAVLAGHLAVVQVLLASGKVDLHLEDSKGQTALRLAVVSGQIEMVRLLSLSPQGLKTLGPSHGPAKNDDGKSAQEKRASTDAIGYMGLVKRPFKLSTRPGGCLFSAAEAESGAAACDESGNGFVLS